MSWNWGGRNPDNADFVAPTPEDRGVGGVYEYTGGQTYNTPRSGGGGGSNVSDGINAWKRLEQPYMNYLNQFVSQNPNFRPLQYYSGSTVAGLTPEMRNALGDVYHAGGRAQTVGNNAFYFGQGQMGMGSAYQTGRELTGQQQAADAAAGRMGEWAGYGNTQANRAASGVLGAAGTAAGRMGEWAGYGNTQANRAASGAVGAAGGWFGLNQNGLNQANFNSIANNPALQGQIDAVSQDIMRNTAENVIPGIATSAVGSGNPYSTRTQHSYDTALRQTREAIGDVAAQMRYENFSDARNQTLAQQQQNQAAELSRRGLAQQGYLGGGQLQQGAINAAINAAQGGGQMRMGAHLGAGQLQQDAINAAINAAQVGGQMQMGAHQWAGQLRNQMGQQGVQNQLASSQQFQQAAALRQARGQYYQDYAQAQLDDQVARHMFNQTSPFYTLPLYSNAMAPPAGMPFRIGQGGGMSSGPNLGFF